jgi:hypothetical protein
MREYKNKITLTKNGRGIWTLDPIMGCKTGLEKNKKGCFSDCYAARTARIYGYDFSKNVLRYFDNEKHLKSIINKINKLDFDFIRMGNSGDPSEDWEHTISILEKLKGINKEVVIITRHWNKLTINQLERISKLNVCINTSISPIDKDLHSSIEQYEILKKYCKSILRCVSFDFNTKNSKGMEYSMVQDWVFNTYDVLDTVFRCSKSNPLYKDGIIRIKETKFLGKKCNISKFNRKTYFGNCDNCIEKCGVNM